MMSDLYKMVDFRFLTFDIVILSITDYI